MPFKSHSAYTQVLRSAMLLFLLSFALVSKADKEPSTRILFIFDASSSMLQDWDGRSKISVAKQVLSKSLDSLQRVYPKAQFALRVYGHQSPQRLIDCQDSRLEVPFSRGNIESIKSVLQRIEPRGYTPIAYSLDQASQFDFPNSEQFRNIIVLITDGLEKCDGNPCESAKRMKERGISLEPYVVGLDLGPEGEANFNCVGEYFAVEDAQTLGSVLDVIVTQTLNSTTAQVNLLDYKGDPKETNISFEIREQESGRKVYEYIHTMQGSFVPDTVILFPKTKYVTTVFTTPPVSKKDIVVSSGKHNIIGVDIPMGSLNIQIKGMFGASHVPCLIRKHGEQEIINVQNLNSTERYISGLYDIEILSLPRTYFDSVSIKGNETSTLTIERSGYLSIFPSEPGVVSVFDEQDGKLRKLWESLEIKEKKTLELQPGNYTVVYRSSQNRKSDETKVKQLKITIGKNAVMRF